LSTIVSALNRSLIEARMLWRSSAPTRSMASMASSVEVGRLVGHQYRVFRLQRLDVIEVGEERGLGVAHQHRRAETADHQPIGRGLLNLGHHHSSSRTTT
jgi:hypothetical protein